MIRRLALFVMAFAAAVWVSAPIWHAEESQAPMVRPQPARTGAPAQELKGPAHAPIQFAHQVSCREWAPMCRHWILVSERNERWWLPYGFDETPLALSRDGWLAAYHWDGKETRYVVRDLKTGETRKLPAKIESTVFGDEPLFSLDGRHLVFEQDHLDKRDEIVRDPPMIVELDSGTISRVPTSDGSPVGWTTDGFVLVKSTGADHAPGHIRTAVFTVRSPTGKLVRQFSLPGNYFTGVSISPSGRRLAGLFKEVTPDDVRVAGITLVDTTGKPLRTAVPRAPSGWSIEKIVRWAGEDALVLRLRTSEGRISVQSMELATGVMRPLGVESTEVPSLPLDTVEDSVIVGKID